MTQNPVVHPLQTREKVCPRYMEYVRSRWLTNVVTPRPSHHKETLASDACTQRSATSVAVIARRLTLLPGTVKACSSLPKTIPRPDGTWQRLNTRYTAKSDINKKTIKLPLHARPKSRQRRVALNTNPAMLITIHERSKLLIFDRESAHRPCIPMLRRRLRTHKFRPCSV